EGGRYVAQHEPHTTEGDRDGLRRILLYWLGRGAAMLEAAEGPFERSRIGCRSFVASTDAYLKIAKIIQETYTTVGAVLAADQGEREVYGVLNLQLLYPAEDQAHLPALRESSRPVASKTGDDARIM